MSIAGAPCGASPRRCDGRRWKSRASLGPLVRDGLLVPVGAAGGPGLPEEAQRMSMHNFDLFTLLIGMEQTG